MIEQYYCCHYYYYFHLDWLCGRCDDTYGGFERTKALLHFDTGWGTYCIIYQDVSTSNLFLLYSKVLLKSH